MNLVRSILAVLAGMIAVVALSTGADVALVAAGVFPPFEEAEKFTTGHLLLATAYRALIIVFAGYLTARLAPNSPMQHALILGGIGVAASMAGAIAMWSLSNHWYPIALIVLTLPAIWLGAKLATKSAR